MLSPHADYVKKSRANTATASTKKGSIILAIAGLVINSGSFAFWFLAQQKKVL
jgi:hypothetical protein